MSWACLEYQSLARWFVHSGGVDFPGLVCSSFPHLLPDFTRDSVSGSSLFLAALHSDFSSSFSVPLASASSSSSPSTYLPSSSWAVPPPPPLPPSSHLSSHGLPGGSGGAGLFPMASTSSSTSPSHPPASGFAPPSSSFAPPPSVSAPAPPSHWPSLSSASSLPSSTGGGPSVVHGLGVGPPLSSGVPPYHSYTHDPHASTAAHAPSCPPATAPAYDPHAFDRSIPRPDDFDDPDDRFPDEDHPPLDPSAPSVSLDLSRSEYRRIVEYICGLFPLAVGVPPMEPPPRALFESFFAPPPQSHTPLAFNWFARVQQALMDADSHLAAWVATGGSDRAFLPARHSTYAVRGLHATGRAVPVNESLLSHYERPLRPSLQVGLTVRDLVSLEASFCSQSESLSYAMWVLSGLLGFIRIQGFSPSDPALFNQLVTALSKSLAHQAHVAASRTAYACHKRREFYLSPLPAYFGDSTKCSLLSAPSVFVDSLFREEDIVQLLDSTWSSLSLRSQQAMVDMVSRRPSSSSRPRRASPHRSPPRSPARRRRQFSGSPSRASKRVRFGSPAPASSLKSPRKSHFRE